MPHARATDVHVNQLLGNVGYRYKNTTYIVPECCADVPVKKKTDVYPTWPKSVWFRDEAAVVAPGDRAPTIGLVPTLTNTYRCETWKMAYPLAREVRDNADSQLQLQVRGTELAMDKVQLRKEILGAALFQTTGNWTSTTALAGVTQWSDYTNSDPIGNIDDAKESVRTALGGQEANTFITDMTTWLKLKRHPEVLDLAFGGGWTGSKVVTKKIFADAFEFDKVLVGAAIKTTDEEAAASDTATYSAVWADTTWIGYVAPSPSIITPSAAYNFQLFKRVRTWYEDGGDVDFIEASEAFDLRAVCADCGYTYTDCVA